MWLKHMPAIPCAETKFQLREWGLQGSKSRPPDHRGFGTTSKTNLTQAYSVK